MIAAPPAAVWRELQRLEDHPTWMKDAESVRFDGDRRRGAGTTMTVATRVGPLRTNDRMVVTEWVEGEAIGVRHEGVVTGEGRFTIEAAGAGSTRFTWSERLRFPWWLGGPVGGAVGARVLGRIWLRNLARFRARVERGI